MYTRVKKSKTTTLNRLKNFDYKIERLAYSVVFVYQISLNSFVSELKDLELQQQAACLGR